MSADKEASSVVLLTHDPRWRGRHAPLRKAAAATLNAEKAKGAVTVVLSNDAEVRALNRDYREKDKPTNVLSFPDGETHDGLLSHGDIILAYETIEREALEQGKRLLHHAQHLVVHGVLHLLGYDHEQNATDAEAMEQREIAILSGLGIANPYIAR